MKFIKYQVGGKLPVLQASQLHPRYQTDQLIGVPTLASRGEGGGGGGEIISVSH